MLVQFTLGNYLSFKDNTTLKLGAESLTELAENAFETPITDLKLLKSLVIYGPNATGKSNMFKGLLFMRWFILNSSKELQASEVIDVESFQLNTSTAGQPSFFEIEVIVEDIKYRYGFRVTQQMVVQEWLYQVKKRKEYRLFFRDHQEIISEERFESQIEIRKHTRENALFLSVAGQFNNKIASQIIKKIRNIKLMSGINDESQVEQTARMMEDNRYSQMIRQLVLSANLGFTDIKAERLEVTDEMLSRAGVPEEIRAYILKDKKPQFHVSTLHPVYDENNKPTGATTSLSLLNNESLGTRKFFSMAGPIIECLVKGGTLLIDEFSSRMSPVLCEAIIRLFNSNHNNPNNAQFLFITHNTQFMSKSRNLFRRDQMILFRKNQYGTTDVKSLYDSRARKDASHDKDYLAEIFETLPKLDISRQLSLFQSDAS